MTAAKKLNLVSVEDYLEGELASPIKHEYLNGTVHRRPDERNSHNLIASNVLGFLHMRLRGRQRRPFNSDAKIRILLSTDVRFYHPDASVILRQNPLAHSFQDEPTVIVEVLSKRTRRIDEWEKKEAYLTIPSLGVYLLVEQEMPAVVAFRRTADGFVREVYQGMDAVIPLGEIGAELPLAEIYERVDFVPEPDEEL